METDDMKNYSSEWIYRFENKVHWDYYWYQIKMLRDIVSEQDRILEIGVGTQFLSNYMRSKNYKITTLDIDPEKKPDIIADITVCDLSENFDHILAFEVFEHIPFHEFEKVLHKIHKICNKSLILSVPRNEKVWLEIMIKLPGNRETRFRIITKRRKIITAHHYWELDYNEFTRKRIEKLFLMSGFEIIVRKKVSSLYFYKLKKV